MNFVCLRHGKVTGVIPSIPRLVRFEIPSTWLRLPSSITIEF